MDAALDQLSPVRAAVSDRSGSAAPWMEPAASELLTNYTRHLRLTDQGRAPEWNSL